MKKETNLFLNLILTFSASLFFSVNIYFYFVSNYLNKDSSFNSNSLSRNLEYNQSIPLTNSNYNKEISLNQANIKPSSLSIVNKKEKRNNVPNKKIFLIKKSCILKEVERSTERRNIDIYTLGNCEKNRIAFIGGIHGNEPQGVYIVKKLLEYTQKTPKILDNKKILFIPEINPDAFFKRSRTNANGVDINRNFPSQNWKKSYKKDNYYSGEYASSEIETKILMKYIYKFNPQIIINIHSPYKVVNYDGPALKTSEYISKYNKYPITSNIGYPTFGSFGSYYGIDKKIQVITLETSENDPESEWHNNKKALINLIQNIDKI